MLNPAIQQSSILTVSQLNAQIKGLLESNYPYVWVRGEISNFRVPASGHYYFTLKDDQSQIRAVFFRPHHRNLRFVPESGLEVLCQGRLSVYEPRGEYQLIVDVMEPQGLGALYLAFEQLKKKLKAEGLFDPDLKRRLPACPQRVAIVTSPTGAAIQDILKVFRRSPCSLSVTLLPVRVQGNGASKEIADAIAAANKLAVQFKWDVLIVGRGGGSIEDLWPFNEEEVARAISLSVIPVISAVGHEIDVTISDLVADLRSPTPTAAAQWVITQLESLHRELASHLDRAQNAFSRMIQSHRQKADFLRRRLVHPKRRIEDLRLFVDDRLDRLRMAVSRRLERVRTHQGRLAEKLYFYIPLKKILDCRVLLDSYTRELVSHQYQILERQGFKIQRLVSKLESLSPLAVLSRGYSITYRLPDLQVVRRGEEAPVGAKVRIQLFQGNLECLVRVSHGGADPSEDGRMEDGQEKE